MSMDLTPLLFGKQAWSWKEECLVSVLFGAIVLFVAYYFDHKTTLDFSFWVYLFGALTFWGGLSAMDSASELGKFFYFLINIAMLLTSAILGRKVFAVFGSLGIFGYLGHLAYTVFKNSMMFPFVLSLIGIGVIYFAIKYQKNQKTIDDAIRRILGSPFKIPARG